MVNTKAISVFLFALIAFSMLANVVLASHHHLHNRNHNRYRNRYGPGTVKRYQCYGRCAQRCSDTGHYNNCMLFCNKCCNKCLCVPPGTYGNKQVCACYNNWKTKEGGPKCP